MTLPAPEEPRAVEGLLAEILRELRRLQRIVCPHKRVEKLAPLGTRCRDCGHLDISGEDD